MTELRLMEWIDLDVQDYLHICMSWRYFVTIPFHQQYPSLELNQKSWANLGFTYLKATARSSAHQQTYIPGLPGFSQPPISKSYFGDPRNLSKSQLLQILMRFPFSHTYRVPQQKLWLLQFSHKIEIYAVLLSIVDFLSSKGCMRYKNFFIQVWQL